MTPDDKLDAFFASSAPPARDLVFQAEVAARVARRRIWISALASVPWAIAATTLLWVSGPRLTPILEGLGQDLAPAALTLAAVGLALATSHFVLRRLQT